ncbi:type I-U CRISPR-associated protein Csb2 [Actinomadura sp. DC4]|uniref:type I-G CRISPR-associated protein Csb2 n=1 Tax=Actinomadura sp. DC4 TaxID=3055069 RepID=UPI0025B00CFC|nr:type I-U CRISPR-associated protein Csb2 [Actinomadura sp. DC4]MDN3360103.1 type I-U CRISPR-associated protein Csb2 [Actinomadura sp. DC4]
MPLSILVRLRDGRYDAGGGRPDAAEWPPHPARLFCALVASAADEGDWQALGWLERAGSPEVWAAGEYTSVRRDSYVVTNKTNGKGGSQQHLGRTSVMRTRFSAEPADPEFAVVWPDASPGPDIVRALSRLARRVPYLGRTTSPVTLVVGTEPAELRKEWGRLVPTRLGAPSAASLRVPYDGYTERLRDAYQDGRRSWEVARTIPYATPEAPAGPMPKVSPFGEMLIFGAARGTVKVAGGSLLTVTARLREAVMARIGIDLPAQISGHGADDKRHLAYLALPHVGHRHADGRILGVAVAVPTDLDGDAYGRLWQAIVDAPLERLTLRRDQVLELEPPMSVPSAWGLSPERWTAADRGGSRTWVTATPLMLDRFLKRSRDEDAAVKEVFGSVVRAGYPEPEEVTFSPAPMIEGAPHRPRTDTLPAGRPRRPMVHARITFGERIAGPVLVGSMRYFGLGLLVPTGEGR